MGARCAHRKPVLECQAPPPGVADLECKVGKPTPRMVPPASRRRREWANISASFLSPFFCAASSRSSRIRRRIVIAAQLRGKAAVLRWKNPHSPNGTWTDDRTPRDRRKDSDPDVSRERNRMHIATGSRNHSFLQASFRATARARSRAVAIAHVDRSRYSGRRRFGPVLDEAGSPAAPCPSRSGRRQRLPGLVQFSVVRRGSLLRHSTISGKRTQAGHSGVR